jgi:NADPH-dependent ferric siderophore reductase
VSSPLPEPSAWHLEVVDTRMLTPSFQRLTFTAPGLDGFHYAAGQDMMFRVPREGGASTNRRYTIRAFDAARSALIVDVALHGTGPGISWLRAAEIGDEIEAYGPRGKITPRAGAEWHLFVADETGVPGALAMIEALPESSPAVAVLEIDAPTDEQEVAIAPGHQVSVYWVNRLERSAPGDAALLQEAVGNLMLPPGDGHAYLAAEAGVVSTLQKQLTAQMGLEPDQVSGKAYWRRGVPNADHGEPARNPS